MKKRLLARTVLSLSMFVIAPAQAGQTKAPSAGVAQTVEVTRDSTQPSQKGPAENFTDFVRVDPLFPAREPSRAVGASLTFEAGPVSPWAS